MISEPYVRLIQVPVVGFDDANCLFIDLGSIMIREQILMCAENPESFYQVLGLIYFSMKRIKLNWKGIGSIRVFFSFDVNIFLLPQVDSTHRFAPE